MSNDQFDVIEVAARSEFNGVDDIVNVWQFQITTPGSINDAGVAGDLIGILEAFYNLINAGISLLQLYRDLRLTNITKGTVLGIYPWATLVAGAAADEPTPPGVATLLNFSTDIPRVAPRKYIGVTTEVRVDSQGFLDAGWVALNASAGALMIGVLTGTLGTYLYGYQSPKTLTFEPVKALTVTNVPAYQRRRKQGRGS